MMNPTRNFILLCVLQAACVMCPVATAVAHDHAPSSGTSSAAAGHDESEAHEDEVKLTPQAIKQYGVQVQKASRTSLSGQFTAPARVSFNTDAMAHVGSAVTGRATELKIKLGDVVKKGDVLIVVDSPELGEAQSDYLLKRTAVETCRPAAQLAKDACDRARQLYDQTQGIALAEVERRKVEWSQAQGNLHAAEAAATAAENKLHLYGMSQQDVKALVDSGEISPRYKVRAPISGQIVEREVTLGELVRPDRDALLVIADLSSVWVIADVPEARVADVAVGAHAAVKAAAISGRTLEGRVTYIAPALDPNTRSAKVRIEVKDGVGALMPGMFVQAAITMHNTAAAEKVLAIPEQAVQMVEGGPAVFVPVADEENTFTKRSVRIGPVTAGMVQVLSGLVEGDELVVSGSFILKAELGKAGAAHEH